MTTKTMPSLSELIDSQGKIAIIGAGGIGSHFCRTLDKLIIGEQLKLDRQQVVVFDFDIVSPSNLKHQDYSSEELNIPKSMIMGLRYDFDCQCRRFEKEDLANFMTYIICADNQKVRDVVFNSVSTVNSKHKTNNTNDQFARYFIDMRAEGDMTAVFTQKAPIEMLNTSLGADKTSEIGTSCQTMEDRMVGKIQLGNFSVAVTGAQVLLKMYRNEEYPAKLVRGVV